jgi:hypothetical protein
MTDPFLSLGIIGIGIAALGIILLMISIAGMFRSG